MNFENALYAMRNEHASVRRKIWNKTGNLTVIEIMVWDKNPDRTGIDLTGQDIMAADWEVVEDAEGDNQ